MQVTFRRLEWEFKSVFRIAYRTRTHAQTVLVQLKDGDFVGRGEAAGVSYHGETVETLLEQLASVANDLRNGLSREALQSLLPPGGARSGIDCALWDLEAKRAGCRAWELAGMSSVSPILTDYTLGIDTPEAMAKAAVAASHHPLLKIKLLGEGDIERVALIRNARPDARLIVDANQAWNVQQVHEYVPQLAKLGVELIEQPLPAGQDDALEGFEGPIPLCADESCQTRESLPSLKGRYQFINIKLDKTGGLTEALRLTQAAKARGLRLMVGCMAGSSLAMAPAFIVGQMCEIADLDSPLLIKSDMPHAVRYEHGCMFAPEASLWG